MKKNQEDIQKNQKESKNKRSKQFWQKLFNNLNIFQKYKNFRKAKNQFPSPNIFVFDFF